MNRNYLAYLVSILMISLFLIGCTNNQTEQQREQLDTEPISFSGDNPQTSKEYQDQETKRPIIPIQPGREQNIFEGNQQAPKEKPVPSQEGQTTKKPQTSAGGTFQAEVVQLTNKERKKQGLNGLQTDSELVEVAQTKAEDMANANYFSHTSPTYGSPFDMLQQFGVEYTTAAENIAAGQLSPEEVVTGWMNSPGHKKNILNKKITHIGVGYAKDGAYWTQMFIAK